MMWRTKWMIHENGGGGGGREREVSITEHGGKYIRQGRAEKIYCY
jgi:hypothetical protein